MCHSERRKGAKSIWLICNSKILQALRAFTPCPRSGIADYRLLIDRLTTQLDD